MQGGHGCISVTSNLIPGLCRALFLAIRDHQASVAEQLMAQYADVTSCLFVETSPTPLKLALSRLGWMTPVLRLPLVPPGETARADVLAMLARLAADPCGEMSGRRAVA
jgi:4-hydroxy-tetrahydrodipicolinate synthase